MTKTICTCLSLQSVFLYQLQLHSQHEYTIASYMIISRQCWRAPHGYQLENFPVATSSICNTHDSVSIPTNPVYARVYVYVVSYPDRNLRLVYTKTESYHTSYLACTKCYSGQLAFLSIVITIGHGALMLQVHDDVNVPAWNLLYWL